MCVMLISSAETADLLLSHDNILIISHKNPDGDTLGSAFALFHGLCDLNKKVRFICHHKIPRKFDFLTLGRPYALTPDFTPDFIVAVDVAATQLLGSSLMCYNDKIDICIDHHPTNEQFATKTFLDPKAGATCEVIFDLLAQMNIEVTPLIADCMYTGIVTDTGCFKYSNTTAKTHKTTAKLFELGANYEWINRVMFDTKSKKRFAIEQRILDTLEYFGDGKIAVITITAQMLLDEGIDDSELDGISALPRTIEGVEVGITLREKKSGFFKASVRTTSLYDASKICEKFGGGGHKRAAGCVIEKDLENAKALIVQAVIL